MRKLVFLLYAVMAFVVLSCSKDDYVNAVPANSTAVMSVDAGALGGDSRLAGLLKSLFKVHDLADCGINLADKIYVFETSDGSFGLVASVGSRGKVEEMFGKMSENGACTALVERKGFGFTLLGNAWLAGFSSNALVVLGPVVAAQQDGLQLRIASWLGQGEEEGIKASPLFAELESHDGAPFALAARLSALPESFAAPLMLGAPKSADASQVVLSAKIEAVGSRLDIEGKTLSFNGQVNSALEEASKVFRPLKGRYLGTVPKDAVASVFMNANGNDLIKLLHGNNALAGLLMGMNMVVDMDNIIRSVDGDMAISLMDFKGESPDVRIAAELADRSFLADVGYWKQSCPKGGRIDDLGKDSYCYSNGGTDFCFGVSADSQFYTSSERASADVALRPSSSPLRDDVRQAVKAGRLCIVLSIPSVVGSYADNAIVKGIVQSLLGDIDTVVIKFS